MSNWEDSLKLAVGRLNPYQRAIHDFALDESDIRPLRVIACAGAGKTACVVATVADGLSRPNAFRQGVIVTTFTRKAGDELTARLKALTSAQSLARLTDASRLGHGRVILEQQVMQKDRQVLFIIQSTIKDQAVWLKGGTQGILPPDGCPIQ
jgi:hypothetical protein